MFTRAYTSTKDDLMAEKFGTRIYFNASTSTLARDGMSLRTDRWKLDNYHRAGGPVLWAHKHDMPAIGSGEAKTDPNRLRVGVVFDQEDPFAKAVESKVRRKFIRGSSVGWDFVTADGEVIKNNRAFLPSLARDAFYDLSEMSVVNVPSDPQAVSERNWRALRSLHPGLTDLYEAQERWDSDVTEPQVRQALIDYCNQLGLDLRFIRAAATGNAGPGTGDGDLDAELDKSKEDDELSEEDNAGQGDDGEPGDTTLVRRSQLPDLLRAHGLEPNTQNHGEPTPDPSTVDERAAQAVLTAFAFHS